MFAAIPEAPQIDASLIASKQQRGGLLPGRIARCGAVPGDFAISTLEAWEEFPFLENIPVARFPSTNATGYAIHLDAELDDADEDYIKTYEGFTPSPSTQHTIPSLGTNSVTHHYWVAVLAVNGLSIRVLEGPGN